MSMKKRRAASSVLFSARPTQARRTLKSQKVQSLHTHTTSGPPLQLTGFACVVATTLFSKKWRQMKDTHASFQSSLTIHAKQILYIAKSHTSIRTSSEESASSRLSNSPDSRRHRRIHIFKQITRAPDTHHRHRDHFEIRSSPRHLYHPVLPPAHSSPRHAAPHLPRLGCGLGGGRFG